MSFSKYIENSIIILFFIAGFAWAAKGSHKVFCEENLMRVDINMDKNKTNNKSIEQEVTTIPQIYLEGLKGYPDVRCKPKINGTLAVFMLSLKDFHECGVTRMVHELTGKKIFYHKIVVEDANSKQIISVKCSTSPVYIQMMMINGTNRNLQHEQNQSLHHNIMRRDVLPAGFREQEDVEITTSLIEKAPEPILSVSVRQGTQLITGELNVSPGTALTMEIYLDKSSAPVYGLGVTYMQVTDTKAQEETIIFNGCSVDPYLFDNFNTIDGDILISKFRAFKFPESTYVQFRATVNVCLDKCAGSPCSNGQIGFGRKKREIGKMDRSKIYEISVATFIRVNDDSTSNHNDNLQWEKKLEELKLINQRLSRNSRGSFLEPLKSSEMILTSVSAMVADEKELNDGIDGKINNARNACARLQSKIVPLLFLFYIQRKNL